MAMQEQEKQGIAGQIQRSYNLADNLIKGFIDETRPTLNNLDKKLKKKKENDIKKFYKCLKSMPKGYIVVLYKNKKYLKNILKYYRRLKKICTDVIPRDSQYGGSVNALEMCVRLIERLLRS